MVWLLLLVPTAAGAEVEVWGPPDGAVVPSGPVAFAVVRRSGADGPLVPIGEVAPRAEPGTLEALDSDPVVARWLYVPPPGYAGEATVEVAGAQRRWTLSTAVLGRVEIEASPTELLKGRDEAATLRIRLLDAEGRPRTAARAPRLAVNVGTVEGLHAVGPGTFEARYRPGPKRYPEVAVVTAFAPAPHDDAPTFAVAHVALPLSAAIELPGRTRPKVQLTVEIAGRRFGPVASGPDGRFEIPVVVPPGHGLGRGVSVDRLGNRRITRIDLHLPPTNRLSAAVHPTRLPADGHARAQVVVFVVDAFGRPAAGRPPHIEAEAGRVGRLRSLGGGAWAAWYQAPEGVGAGRDVLRGVLPGERRSHFEVTLEL
ncbi:MAG: hypothetical protein D6729_14120, partial [Deltaproteobacteria bacterium]